MKITFPLPTDNKPHEYCVYCSSEDIERLKKDDRTVIHCNNCGKESSRRISIDPKLVWRVDPDTKELIHESVGIFLSNSEGNILFFELTKFPFGLTVPAGHLDVGENPIDAIRRELLEETALVAEDIELVSEENIEGDSCGRGADIHFWHLYKGRVSANAQMQIDEHEGTMPVWLSVAEAKEKNLPFAPRYFIEKYDDSLVSKA